MTQRREVEGRLALYDDLSGILGAMRSFALAELHRVTHREQAQQQVVQSLTEALQDMASFLPQQHDARGDIWLLFGSVRGFCGSFNEEVVHAWQQASKADFPVVVVGERLESTMPDSPAIISVAGAEGTLDASMAIDRVLVAIQQARQIAGDRCGLVACIRDEEGARMQRLLPLPLSHDNNPVPPLMNEPAVSVASGVAEHFLFHMLLSLQLLSIRVENRMRLMQMENALQHLEHGREDLNRQRNRMRQEEIVEEIELMSRSRA
jgi:F-type H+-transporting ATPase subunit gamma